ncbi:hypothetical protein TZ02_18820 [Clostridium aceticum]|nr:hypothetical protein TZ02_18820 [Clostridium aceticum]
MLNLTKDGDDDKVFFKIYSIIVACMTGVVLYYTRNVMTGLWWLFTLIPCVGVYFYGSRKRLFTTKIWKVLFYFYIMFSISYEFIRPLVYEQAPVDLSFLFSFLITASLWVGLYLYAFRFMSEQETKQHS